MHPCTKMWSFVSSWQIKENSHCWPLYKSANADIAAGSTAERYLQEDSKWLPLWQEQSPQPDWNLCPCSFSFMWKMRKKLHGAKSAEYGRFEKMVTWCFASSSWTSTEWCAGMLSCINREFFLHQSSGCIQIELCRRQTISLCLFTVALLWWISHEQFQMG